MKIQYILGTIILAFLIISCDPVGNSIASQEESAQETNLVQTFENLNLKKGDKIVIWGVFSAIFYKNDKPPIYSLDYNLSLDDESVSYNSLIMFKKENHIINSSSKVDYRDKIVIDSHSTTTEEEEYKDWTFEQEIITIEIPKDGNYIFDYKILMESNPSKLSFPKVGLIIRKL